MITVDRTIAKQFLNGELSTKQFADYLLRTFPVTEIALALAENFEYEQDMKPIVISQDEFNAHFRIRGTRTDGETERRGRKPKDDMTP